jgi:hypothetical protein
MSIFTAVGAAIFGAGTFLAGATAAVLQVAAGVGLNLLAKAFAGKSEQPATPGFSVQGKLQAAGDVGRSFMIGRGCTAGSLVYTGTWGQSGNSPNAYFVRVVSLSDLPVASLSEVWVNGVKCTLGALHADYGYAITEYNKDGKDHLWVKFYDGTQTTPDAYLVAKFQASSRPYQSTRVGVGVAYAICTALVADDLFTGFPEFKFGLNGVKFYDPSRDSTVGGSGTQRWDTPSTWGGDGDHLPAVQIYNVLRGVSYNSAWFYGLQQMTAARLPLANWLAQIDKCRTAVAGPSGPEPRYRAGGEIRVGNQLRATVEQLITSCQGRLSEVGGVYKLHLGEPDDAVASFTDADILSTEGQSHAPFFGLADTVNGIAATYPAPEEAWNDKPAPPLYRTDLEVLAGNRRLMADVALDLVPYARQVQDLMQTALAEAQRARRHTFHLPPQYWLVEPGDTVEWTSTRNGYEEKLFRVDGVVDKGDLDVILDLTEIDPADFEFDFETDYTAPTTGPAIILRPPAQAIVDWDAQPYVVTDGNDQPRQPAILLSWEGAEDSGVVGVQYEVRLAINDEVVSRGRTDDVAAGSLIISQNIVPLTDYEARGRYIPSSPREVAWSSWIAVTSPDVRIDRDMLSRELDARLRQVEERLPDILTVRKELGELAGAVNTQITTLIERLGRVNIGAGARYNENKAAVEIALAATADAQSAVAQLEIELSSEIQDMSDTITNTITAGGRIRFVTSATVTGAVASIAIEVNTGTPESPTWSRAGIYLDAFS